MHAVFIFIFRRLSWFLTAFRLGEIVAHASGTIMFLVFANLVSRINGTLVSHPTLQQLRSEASELANKQRTLARDADGDRLAPRNRAQDLSDREGRNRPDIPNDLLVAHISDVTTRARIQRARRHRASPRLSSTQPGGLRNHPGRRSRDQLVADVGKEGSWVVARRHGSRRR